MRALALFVMLMLTGCGKEGPSATGDATTESDASSSAPCAPPPGSECCSRDYSCRTVSACGGTCKVCSYCSAGRWVENGDDCHFGPCAYRDTGTPDDGLIPTATPIAVPPPGTYAAPLRIVFTSSTPGAAIHAAMGTATPSVSSPKLTEPVTLWSTGTVRALAVAPGYRQSEVYTGTFEIAEDPATGCGQRIAPLDNCPTACRITYALVVSSTDTCRFQQYVCVRKGPVDASTSTCFVHVVSGTIHWFAFAERPEGPDWRECTADEFARVKSSTYCTGDAGVDGGDADEAG